MTTKSKILISLISLAVFLTGMPAFEFSLLKTDSALSLGSQIEIAFLEGNSLMASSNPSDPEPKVVRKLPVIVTAYSSTSWETDDDPFITAAGTMVREGIIANNLLPFGTKVRLPEIYGERVFTVEDRMNQRKGYYHFDIWFPSYWEAKEFGAKNTYIEVLES